MKLNIALATETLQNFMRKCGYAPDGIDKKTGELAFAKSIMGRAFPRFHIYAKNQAQGVYSVNLHLDQKAPSYQGTSAHAGEYNSPLVEQEGKRISALA